MPETLLCSKSETEEIIQDNKKYTLFSWSKQKGTNPIAVKYGEGVYLYDYDGKKCMQLRQQWWEEGMADDWTFLFYHDIKTPVYPAL